MKIRILGVLEPFLETGTEGVMWALVEDGKQGYESLHILKEGDHLLIYGEGGEILFAGVIRCNSQVGWTEYPFNPGHGQPSALGWWIHWTQDGWRPDDWAKLFFHQHLQENKGRAALRAELTRNKTS